eukprot:5684367-Alexandrium_andersonii.AAC.1
MPRAPPGHPRRPRGRNGLLLPREGWFGHVLDCLGADGPHLSGDPSTPGLAQRPPARGHGGPSGVQPPQ